MTSNEPVVNVLLVYACVVPDRSFCSDDDVESMRTEMACPIRECNALIKLLCQNLIVDRQHPHTLTQRKTINTVHSTTAVYVAWVLIRDGKQDKPLCL